MYNTNFNVKYYDIAKELIVKLKNKTELKNTNTNEEPDNNSEEVEVQEEEVQEEVEEVEVEEVEVEEEVAEEVAEEEEEAEAEEDYEYTSEDIITICDKLYRDELLSVFYAESIIDEKLDKNMQYVLDQLNSNPEFKYIFDETKHLLYLHELDQTKNLTEEQKNIVKNNYDYVVILTFFSQPLFYITHKCICQQLTTGTVETNLLHELKNCTIKVLNDKNKKEV
jgi:hypothetical protein